MKGWPHFWPLGVTKKGATAVAVQTISEENDNRRAELARLREQLIKQTVKNTIEGKK